MGGPSYHGRTHTTNGTDPIHGLTYPWAYATSFETGIAANTGATYYFDLNDFYTNDDTSFDSAVNGSDSGIRVLRAGLYRLSFNANLFLSSSIEETKAAQLWYTGGGGSFSQSGFSFGKTQTYGQKYSPFSGTGTIFELFRQELWNFPTSGSYPATAIIVGVRHNATVNADGGGSIVIERLGDEVPGGIT